MARNVPNANAQISTPAAGNRLDLAERMKVLEDFLRTYTDGEAIPAATLTITKALPDAAGDVDITIPAGITLRVQDFKILKTVAVAGANANTVTLKNAANAITDAVSMINDAVGDIDRCVSVLPAQRDLVGPATLRFTTAKAGGSAQCEAHVECLLIA